MPGTGVGIRQRSNRQRVPVYTPVYCWRNRRCLYLWRRSRRRDPGIGAPAPMPGTGV